MSAVFTQFDELGINKAAPSSKLCQDLGKQREEVSACLHKCMGQREAKGQPQHNLPSLFIQALGQNTTDGATYGQQTLLSQF